MPRATSSARFAFVIVASVCTVWVGPIGAQGLSKPTPNAKACAYLPISELEAHFGAKALNIQGLDQSTRNTCSARFPDPFHIASIESHPSSSADLAMTAEQRLSFLKQGMKKELLDTRDFGSIGCFQSSVDMGKPVRVVTCFLAKAPYLALSLQSVDAAQTGYDAAKSLLEKAAARRK
jgi:hypothetical protein